MSNKIKINQEAEKNRLNPRLSWCLIGLLLIALVFVYFATAPEEMVNIEFNRPGWWQISPGAKAILQNNALELTRGSGEGFVVVPRLNIDADWYDTCVIEACLPVAFDQGRLFFISPSNNRYDANFSYNYDTGSANRYNRIFIDLKSHPAWQGYIREILLFPNYNAGVVKLKCIKFIHANIASKILGLWSNFTYYYDPKLGTCFSMASPRVFNRSYNSLFIPLFLFIFMVLLIVKLIITDQRIITLINKWLFLPIIVVLLIGWGILDLRNNVYYWKAMQRDINLYWGKSLEQKRGIVTGDPEFVDFMNFCDREIPLEGKIVNCVEENLPGTSNNYLASTQVFFILRPRLGNIPNCNQLGKSYYLLYKPSQAKLKSLAIDKLTEFKRFNNNAYILVSK